MEHNEQLAVSICSIALGLLAVSFTISNGFASDCFKYGAVLALLIALFVLKRPASTPLGKFKKWLDGRIKELEKLRPAVGSALSYKYIDDVNKWLESTEQGLKIAFGNKSLQVQDLTNCPNASDLVFFRAVYDSENVAEDFNRNWLDKHLEYLRKLKQTTTAEQFAPAFRPEDL